MKKRIIKTSVIGAFLIVGIPMISLLFLGTGPESFGPSEVIGYSTILVAMGLIFFAIKSYRDQENEGLLKFEEGLKMGLAIAALGGLAFALYNVLYVLVIDPEFTEKYLAYSEGLDRNSADFADKYNAILEEYGFWMTTEGQTFTMFMTVFLIGLIVSVISALVLQKKPSTLNA